ncbi:MAG: hypothetical protein AAFP86_03110 [Planctomycetota bacterium]
MRTTTLALTLLPLALPAVLVGSAASAAAATATQDAASEEASAVLPPATWRLVQHTLKDASWGNQASHTLLAPAGWKVEGGAWYGPPQAFKVFASQNITLTAPDGCIVEIGPDMSFIDRTMVTMNGPQRLPSKSLDGGSIVLHYPGSTRGFAKVVRDLLKESRPKAKGVRIVEAREVPELTQPLQKSLAPMRQMFANQARSMGARTSVDGSVIGVELSYKEDGEKWSHVELFAQSAFGFEMPSAWNQMGVPGNDLFTSWSVSGSLSFRAPKERLEELALVALAVRSSLRPTDAWMRMQARHRAKIQKISHEMAMDNMRTAANISRISANASSEILDMQARGYESRQAIRDESHARAVNAMREVHEYRVPGEDLPVALPSYYEHVYGNGNGEFILTNDANYEPGTDLDLTGDWQSLERVR